MFSDREYKAPVSFPRKRESKRLAAFSGLLLSQE
jgi:hypothetical protein